MVAQKTKKDIGDIEKAHRINFLCATKILI